MIEDSWFTVTKINDETYAISELGHWEKVHSFLLTGTNEAVLIDTGLGIDSIRRIVDKITRLPVTVVTTHVHADHIGNHNEFDKVAVHHLEVEWLEGGIPGLSDEMIMHNLLRDITKPIPENFDANAFELYKGQPDIVLYDNDELDLGHRTIKVLHTPGHSPGHISILDLKYKFLFTGDLLYIDTPIYAFYPTTNPKDLLNSLEKITKIKEIERIFGSHNTLGLDPNIFEDVKSAVKYLRDNDLDHFGTGEHNFKQISIKF